MYHNSSNFPIVTPHSDNHWVIVGREIPNVTFSIKEISTSSILVSPCFNSLGGSSIYNMCHTYLFQEKLFSLLPSSYNSIKCMVYGLIAIFFGWLVSLSGFRDSCILPTVEVGSSWTLEGISFVILLKATLMDFSINLLLKLVIVFYVVFVNFMKLTSYSTLGSHNILFWGQWLLNIMQLKNLLLYLFMASVQGRKTLHKLSTSLERSIVYDRRGMIFFPWVSWAFGIGYTLFYVSGLFLGVTLFTLYVKLRERDSLK